MSRTLVLVVSFIAAVVTTLNAQPRIALGATTADSELSSNHDENKADQGRTARYLPHAPAGRRAATTKVVSLEAPRERGARGRIGGRSAAGRRSDASRRINGATPHRLPPDGLGQHYDRESGEYTSQDPIGIEGSFALYSYAHDPLGWLDPLGLKSCADRQQAMLDKNVGYNVSPEEWFQNYSHLGRYGTFVTDKKAFRDVLGHARPGKYAVGRKAGKGRISRKQARDLERALGIEPGSLRNGFRITKVEGVRDMSPRSPLEGNQFFLGPGKGLPGGGPEMVIDPVPTT